MQIQRWRIISWALVLMIAAVCAWIMTADPLGFHQARQRASLTPELRQLVTDLSAKEPWYYRLVCEVNTSTGSLKSFSRFIPTKLSNAAAWSRAYANATNGVAVKKLYLLGTNAYPAIPAMVDNLQDKSESVRDYTFAILSAIHAENDPRLAQALRAQSDFRRPVETFLQFTGRQLVGWEVYLLPGTQPGYSRFAWAALRDCVPSAKSALPEIIKLASDEHDLGTRTNAILCLGAIGPDAGKAIPLLKKILETQYDEWPQVRAAATDAIAQIAPNDPATIPLLKKLEDNPQGLVRVSAAMALWRCKAAPTTEVLDVLDHALDHKLASVRTAAIQGIAEMGEDAQSLKEKAGKSLLN